jgi:hypothetical protein
LNGLVGRKEANDLMDRFFEKPHMQQSALLRMARWLRDHPSISLFVTFLTLLGGYKLGHKLKKWYKNKEPIVLEFKLMGVDGTGHEVSVDKADFQKAIAATKSALGKGLNWDKPMQNKTHTTITIPLTVPRSWIYDNEDLGTIQRKVIRQLARNYDLSTLMFQDQHGIELGKLFDNEVEITIPIYRPLFDVESECSNPT